MPVTLITGIAGQDGSYLAELLLAKGYAVHGLVRDSARALLAANLADVTDRIQFHAVPLTDASGLAALCQRLQPDEVYHLAGQTHVPVSFADPLGTLRDNVLGTAAILAACHATQPTPRLFHASTSQIFGQPAQEPQDETTPVRPISPYGASKACATDLVRIARETGGLFAVSGILYNHESPRRGPEFVTGKICRAAAAIRQGRETTLRLGDLHARRDWGDARDFVRGFWQSLQADQPADYVFATGQLHSVEDVCELAFTTVGLDWRKHVQVDAALFRPAEPVRLVGNPAKAERVLGWQPRRDLAALVQWMIEAELADLGRLG